MIIVYLFTNDGFMSKVIFASILCIVLFGGAYFLASPQKQPVQATLAVSDALGENQAADSAYTRVFAPRPFIFPNDHAPHDDYKTEWWYFTGNLKTRTGKRFGYQLTFFRSALAPVSNITSEVTYHDSVEQKNAWKARQIFMAHFTITDVEGKKFYSAERFSRVAQDLAGCTLSPQNALRIWLEDWSAQSTAFTNEYQQGSVFPMRLQAVEKGLVLDVVLDSVKPVILQGDKGFSAKSQDAGNASYYYSLTRLQTRGKITLPSGETAELEGTSWFDREWSTSALAKNQIGWDWFALHLEDGREFMFYQIRRRDGTSDPTSKGVLVAQNGTSTTLTQTEVVLTPRGEWKSPAGTQYPASWDISIPKEQLTFQLIPQVQNQELDVTVRYWEGSVRVQGEQAQKPISGYGYVEMTGYSDVKTLAKAQK